MGRSLRIRCPSLFSGDYRDQFNIGEVYIKSILSQGKQQTPINYPESCPLVTKSWAPQPPGLPNCYVGPCGLPPGWFPGNTFDSLKSLSKAWGQASSAGLGATSPGFVQSSRADSKASLYRLWLHFFLPQPLRCRVQSLGRMQAKVCCLFKTSPSTIIMTDELKPETPGPGVLVQALPLNSCITLSLSVLFCKMGTNIFVLLTSQGCGDQMIGRIWKDSENYNVSANTVIHYWFSLI